MRKFPTVFRYQSRNWREYNRALINRGRLTGRVRRARDRRVAQHRAGHGTGRTALLCGYGHRVGPRLQSRQWGAVEQLWNTFHNCSYRSPHIMEGYRARGYSNRLPEPLVLLVS
jgi:hypothetical protein